MKRGVGIAIVLCVITQLVVPSYGQRSDLAVLEQSIRQLEDPKWKTRRDAFYILLKRGLPNVLRQWPERSDELKLALIKLLERENAFSREYRESVYKRTGVPLGEEYGDYHGDLIEAVTSLKDIRSLNALIGVIETGNMVTSTLAEFGNDALDRVVEVFNSGGTARVSAGLVLAKMLDAKNAPKVSDPVPRQKIKDTLIRAAGDPSRFVRLAGIEGLRRVGGPEVVSLLQKLATSDPEETVRNAATEALKKPR